MTHHYKYSCRLENVNTVRNNLRDTFHIQVSMICHIRHRINVKVSRSWLRTIYVNCRLTPWTPRHDRVLFLHLEHFQISKRIDGGPLHLSERNVVRFTIQSSTTVL